MYTLFLKTPSGICSTPSSIFRHNYQPVKRLAWKWVTAQSHPVRRSYPGWKKTWTWISPVYGPIPYFCKTSLIPKFPLTPPCRQEFFKCFRDTEEILRGNVHIAFRFEKPPTPQFHSLSSTKLYLWWRTITVWSLSWEIFPCIKTLAAWLKIGKTFA